MAEQIPWVTEVTANVALFLAPELASFIKGADIEVDDGWAQIQSLQRRSISAR